MPGIFGFFDNKNQGSHAKLLADMASGLDLDLTAKFESYLEPGLGIGRISLGIVNPEPQPIWNDDRTLCIVMEGELYDTRSLSVDMSGLGHRLLTSNPAELMLCLYQEYGEAFAERLNGAFVAAIWNATQKRLVLVNDRMGLYPLYYASVNGRFLFGSGVRALLADASLSRQVDRVSIAQFLTFDHPLGDRTLLSAVRLMPQGSLLVVEQGDYSIQPYASLQYPKTYPLHREEEYREELVLLLRQAVARQAADVLPKAIMLSGGLDSRVLVALLNEIDADWPFYTFTWGLPGCDDARFAAEISRFTRAEHHFFELKPDFLLSTAEESVRITDGMGNIVNLHAFVSLDEETRYAQMIYKGFMGDAMFGRAVEPILWADYDPGVGVQAHLRLHELQGVLTFLPAEHHTLFTDEFQRDVGNAVMDSYQAGMEASGTTQLAAQRLYFDLTQRVPRMTIKGVEVVRSKAFVRLPFCDNDLLHFAQQVPLGMLQDRHLIREAFQTTFPKMASVPFSWTGLPMVDNFRSISMRARRLLQWHLYQRGISSQSEVRWRPYKDYQGWFRTVLRDWVEGILLSQSSLDRGYYNPEFVKQLVAEHMAGANHTVKLGALLSIELWHQLCIDGA